MSTLRYTTDRAKLVQMAREAGKTTEQIVAELTRGESAERVRAIARDYAPHLGVTEVEFRKIAGPRSR